MTLPGMTSIPCVRFAMAHRDDKAPGYIEPTAAATQRLTVGWAIAAAWQAGRAQAMRSVVAHAGEARDGLLTVGQP